MNENKHYYNCYEEGDSVRVEIGGHHTLLIDKLFGPTIGAPLKLEFDKRIENYLVYRRTGGADCQDIWELVATIPLQKDSDFDEQSNTDNA